MVAAADEARRRLEALGGSLSVDSPRGGPTRIRASVPLEATA
jgi:signal transduction histidine kinase